MVAHGRARKIPRRIGNVQINKEVLRDDRRCTEQGKSHCALLCKQLIDPQKGKKHFRVNAL